MPLFPCNSIFHFEFHPPPPKKKNRFSKGFSLTAWPCDFCFFHNVFQRKVGRPVLAGKGFPVGGGARVESIGSCVSPGGPYAAGLFLSFSSGPVDSEVVDYSGDWDRQSGEPPNSQWDQYGGLLGRPIIDWGARGMRRPRHQNEWEKKTKLCH